MIQQLDHIFVSPTSVESLFRLLSEELGLPVHWPMTEFAGGAFRSGGISLNNATLEILSFADPDWCPPSAFGIAFEVDDTLEETIAGLDYVGICCGELISYPAARPEADGLVVNAELTDVLYGTDAFLCHYNHSPRATRAYEALASNGGGLGVTRLKEIHLGVSDFEESLVIWELVLTPHLATEPGYWELGDGPAFRLLEADEDTVTTFVVGVRDLAAARDCLERKGLWSPGETDDVCIDQDLTYPAVFQLVQDVPP